MALTFIFIRHTHIHIYIYYTYIRYNYVFLSIKQESQYFPNSTSFMKISCFVSPLCIWACHRAYWGTYRIEGIIGKDPWVMIFIKSWKIVLNF